MNQRTTPQVAKPTGRQTAAPRVQASDELRQQILGPFLHGRPKIAPNKVSFGYRLTVVLVALGMASLPALYLGLVVAVSLGLVVYAIEAFAIFSGPIAIFWAMLLYALPFPVGLTLIAFMLKPFFAKSVGERGRYAMRPEDEPLLFEFVGAVCAAVGAPKPVRVDLVMDVNAGASFERGVLSFWNNNLVLIIGMPLLTGLTTQQLAGVLAHEFGHFSQGVGMRLSFLIGVINRWLQRSVYERDAWDVWLLDRSSDRSLSRVFFLGIRGGVWALRWLIWPFMMAGHAMSCVLLRQMEFDADRYEARVAGSAIFRETCWRLRIMGVATQFTEDQLQMAWHEQRLADNLPSLIAFNANDLPASVVEEVRKAVSKTTTAWHDTHPADLERVARVEKEPTPGIYHQVQPSTHLLHNFGERARRMSLTLYREAFGNGVSQRNLVPIQRLLEEERVRRKEQKAGARFLQAAFSYRFPVLFEEKRLEPVTKLEAMVAALRDIRVQAGAMLEELPRARKSFREADDALAVLRVLQALRNFNVDVRPFRASGIEIPAPDAIPERIAALNSERQFALVVLEQYRGLTYRRLLCSLRLLHCPEIYTRIGWGIPLVEEAERTLAGLRVFSRYYDYITALTESQMTLELYMNADHSGRLITEIRRQLLRIAGEIHDCMGQLQGALSRTDYPYLHAHGKVTVAQYAIPHIPVAHDLYNLTRGAHHSLEKIGYYYARCLFRACELAENVERVLGMAPFPAPVDGDERP